MNMYNDHEEAACAWTRRLMRKGLVPKGDVDSRSIVDLSPSDLTGYHRIHLFNGICGWEEALRRAGYVGRCLVGSPPCQSFSTAGARKGFDDPRHLWPHMFRLIQATRPPVVFGEQVAAAIGRGWWDLVAGDLESLGYSVSGIILTAACFGAPHRRERLYFGAHLGNRGTVTGDTRRPWAASGSILCPDGRTRRIPRDACPGEAVLGYPLTTETLPNRTAVLKGIGNAIVPECGAAFVRWFVTGDLVTSIAPEYKHRWGEVTSPGGRKVAKSVASPRKHPAPGQWFPTPQTVDSAEARELRFKGVAPSEQGNNRDPDTLGSYRGDLKDWVSVLTPWATATAGDSGKLKPFHESPQPCVAYQAQLAPWPTATASDIKGQDTRSPGKERPVSDYDLPTATEMSPCPTPDADGQRGGQDPQIRIDGGHSVTLQDVASTAPTETKGRLNPYFSAWLMSYSPEWVTAGLVKKEEPRASA